MSAFVETWFMTQDSIKSDIYSEEEETEDKHDNSLQKQKEVDKKRVREKCPVQISLVDTTSNKLKL